MHIINITKKMKKQIPKKEERTEMTKGLLFFVIKEEKNKSIIIVGPK